MLSIEFRRDAGVSLVRAIGENSGFKDDLLPGRKLNKPVRSHSARRAEREEFLSRISERRYQGRVKSTK